MIKNNESNQFLRLFNSHRIISFQDRDFIILSQISKKNNTTIFKVMDGEGNFYACKYIEVNPRDHENHISTYFNEIKKIKEIQLKNERIIKILDYSYDPPYQLSYLLPLGNCDLEDMINNGRCKDANFLRYIWGQMLECVQSLHSCQIIHGNLQPHHFILINGYLVLSNLGYSFSLKSGSNIEPFRFPDDQRYMAPELKQASPIFSYKNDVWSLGCILYQAVYGTLPIIKRGRVDLPEIETTSTRNDIDLLQDIFESIFTSELSDRPTIQELKVHPYITRPTAYFTSSDISIEENLSNLAIQVQQRYIDSEFDCEEAVPLIKRLIEQIKQGQQMKIRAK